MLLDLDTIRAAHERIRPHIHRTPVLTSARLDAELGAKLYFKCENFQKVGAFKARGATNAVFSLTPEEAARGVATHSSGNHAAALARAARLRGILAYIVMPDNSTKTKIRSVEGYGGRITLCAPNARAREITCAEVIARTGAQLVHPFTDFRVMAGQGTAAIELLEDQPDLDAIVCPVGGGGLLSGTAIAAHALKPSIAIIAAEPAGADDAAQSLAAGERITVDHPNTIADGLRTSIGEPNYAIIREHVRRIVTVSDAEIISAMRAVWETLKIIVEPSAAVAFAAARNDRPSLEGKRIGIILTGGNVDLDALPWALPASRT